MLSGQLPVGVGSLAVLVRGLRRKLGIVGSMLKEPALDGLGRRFARGRLGEAQLEMRLSLELTVKLDSRQTLLRGR